MRFFTSVMLMLLLCGAVQADIIIEPAAWDIYEDFSEYEDGTIDQQGIVNDYGFEFEMWNAQDNSSLRYDSGASNVITENGNKYLKLVNRDRSNNIDAAFTSMYFGSDNIISGMGTIYIRYKAFSVNDCIVATNNAFPGYGHNIYGDPLVDGYQGIVTYGDQTQLVRLGGGDQPFRARDGSGYTNIDTMPLASDRWYELWIQLDCSNQQTRYYMCENNGDPAVVANPAGGDWWGWRNTSASTIENLKFFMGYDDQVNEDVVYISAIAVDHEFWRTDQPRSSQPEWWPFPWECPWPWPWPLPGPPPDFNGDGVINLDDFIILKQNYGNDTASLTMGDANQDGVVDLDDFIVLKQYYGMRADDM